MRRLSLAVIFFTTVTIFILYSTYTLAGRLCIYIH